MAPLMNLVGLLLINLTTHYSYSLTLLFAFSHKNSFSIAHMHLHLAHKLEVYKLEVYMASRQMPLINQLIKLSLHIHHLKLPYIN